MEHFQVVAFVFDGTIEGVGQRQIADLSQKWVGFCRDLIATKGPIFDQSLGGPLDHVRIRCTSSDCTGLVSIFIADRLQASYALAKGRPTTEEREILGMFIDSLRGVHRVQPTARQALPFGEILEIQERPLMIVVPWPDAETTVQDTELVTELGIHFAAAFFEASATEH